MKMCAQRKAGRWKRTSPLFFLLPMVPCATSPVTRVSRPPLWEKSKRLRRLQEPIFTNQPFGIVNDSVPFNYNERFLLSLCSQQYTRIMLCSEMNLCYTCLTGDYSLLTIEFDLHRRLGFHMIQVQLFRYAYSRPGEQGVQQPRSQRPLLPVPRSESLAPGDCN